MSTTDPVLSSLTQTDEGWWEVAVTIGDDKIAFKLGGKTEPAPALITHAQDIVADFPAFSHRIKEFLCSEAKRLPGAVSEILQLKVEEICLFWPARPGDGMMYFVGPSEDRLWRCDYIQRKPKGLGFDS